MLVYYLLKLLVTIGDALAGFFGRVDKLPWGLDLALITGMGYFNTIKTSIPVLGTILTAVLVYLGFKLSLIFVKLFLGNRVQNYD